MIDSILFVVLSVPIVILSRRTIFNIKSHGFYRFFAWELILLLFVNNYKYWFKDIFCYRQIASWVFLIAALYTVIAGLILLRRAGNPHHEKRNSPELFHLEKTTKLVEIGVFKYIRHPLYGSLMFLSWGIFLKHTSFALLCVLLSSNLLLYLTAKFDEIECIEYFGKRYEEYMKKTKMFIPFLF